MPIHHQGSCITCSPPGGSVSPVSTKGALYYLFTTRVPVLPVHHQGALYHLFSTKGPLYYLFTTRVPVLTVHHQGALYHLFSTKGALYYLCSLKKPVSFLKIILFLNRRKHLMEWDSLHGVPWPFKVYQKL